MIILLINGIIWVLHKGRQTRVVSSVHSSREETSFGIPEG